MVSSAIPVIWRTELIHLKQSKKPVNWTMFGRNFEPNMTFKKLCTIWCNFHWIHPCSSNTQILNQSSHKCNWLSQPCQNNISKLWTTPKSSRHTLIFQCLHLFLTPITIKTGDSHAVVLPSGITWSVLWRWRAVTWFLHNGLVRRVHTPFQLAAWNLWLLISTINLRT